MSFIPKAVVVFALVLSGCYFWKEPPPASEEDTETPDESTDDVTGTGPEGTGGETDTEGTGTGSIGGTDPSTVIETDTPTESETDPTTVSDTDTGTDTGPAPVCEDGEAECEDKRFLRVCADFDWETVDCKEGDPPQTCYQGECVGECFAGEVRCDDERWVSACDDLGEWTEGDARTDCFATGEVCRKGQCLGPCTEGDVRCDDSRWLSHCGADEIWQGGDERTDCASNDTPQTCVDGACVGECAHGLWECVSDPVGKRQCQSDGTWGEVTPCDICLGEGECREGVCDPENWSCDGATLRLCNDLGDAFIEEEQQECVSSALCDAEHGECDICLPGGDARCTEDGRDKEVCGSDGQGWVVESCPDSICVEGECRTRLCEPREWLCSGSTLRHCNAVGDGFVEEDRKSCESSLLCDAEHGECDVCVPNQDIRCTQDDKDREYCSADGQGWVFEDCPDDICVSGECRSSACLPNEWSCSRETLRHCNQWGDAWLVGDEQVCASSELCDDANAQCDVCVAGSEVCNEAGTKRLECSADGQKQTTVGCPYDVCIGDGQCVECVPGVKRCDSYEYLSTCNASGSWLTGSARRRCYDDGLVCKSGACVTVDCGPPADAANCTETTPGGTTFAKTVTYTCQTGYHITGQANTVKSQSFSCGAGGTWSGSATCSIVDCGAAPTYPNTDRSGSGTTYGFTYEYSCDSSSTGSSGNMTCGDDGTWSGAAPSCSEITCVSLSDPDNGSVSAHGTSLGSKATFSCSTNYHLSTGGNTLTVTCGQNGWSPSIPTCDFDWEYRRDISLSGAAAGLQMLVKLPSAVTSTYNPAELRFSTRADGSSFNLTHHVEEWYDGTVWVRLINGVSTIYMFYGNIMAISTDVGFDSMFPEDDRLMMSPSGYAYMDEGEYSFDYVRLQGGAIIATGPGEVFRINAQKIVIEENAVIRGAGKGYAYGDIGNPGIGGSFEVRGGGGGGAYGGKGGDGGWINDLYYGGPGGSPYGSDDTFGIRMGSSGSEGYGSPDQSGKGGGAVWLNAQEIVFSGTIQVEGYNGAATRAGGGGGSGGGILMFGNYVTVAYSAQLKATGGKGGTGTSASYAGGGGGSGGRIKIFHDTLVNAPPLNEESVYLFTGGEPGGSPSSHEDSPGSAGQYGTAAIDLTSDYSVKSTVHSEVSL